MLTAERLRGVLHYNRETGIFTWLVSLSNRTPAGSVAGGPAGRGYLRVSVDGTTHYAHRLAWLYVYGEWPAGKLDHKNLDRGANWIKNLRPASSAENARNSGKPKNNTSGYKGVCLIKKTGKWHAQITVNWKNIHLGYFQTPEAAYAAYCAAAAKHHGEFARTA